MTCTLLNNNTDGAVPSSGRRYVFGIIIRQDVIVVWRVSRSLDTNNVSVVECRRLDISVDRNGQCE